MTDEQEKLVMSCQRMVVSIAGRYARIEGYDIDDGISVGNLGLIKAAQNFDPRRGLRFSTVAHKYVSLAIKSELHNLTHVVKVPRAALYNLRRLERGDQLNSVGYQFSDKTVASAKKARYGVDRMTDVAEPEDEDFDVERLQLDRDWLCRAVKRLCTRHRDVITWRYGLFGRERRTLKAIGRDLGMTRERVRQLEIEAVVRLREMADERDRADRQGRADRVRAAAQAG